VFPSVGRNVEQMSSQSWPSRFSGEAGDVLVGSVELRDGMGSDELFGCDVEAIGVALDGLEQQSRWVVELAQHGAGGGALRRGRGSAAASRSACAVRWCRVG